MSLFTSLIKELVREPVHEPTIEPVHEHVNEPRSRAFQAELFSVQVRLVYKAELQILFKLDSFIIEPSRKRAFTEPSSEPLASSLARLHP